MTGKIGANHIVIVGAYDKFFCRMYAERLTNLFCFIIAVVAVICTLQCVCRRCHFRYVVIPVAVDTVVAVALAAAAAAFHVCNAGSIHPHFLCNRLPSSGGCVRVCTSACTPFLLLLLLFHEWIDDRQ